MAQWHKQAQPPYLGKWRFFFSQVVHLVDERGHLTNQTGYLNSEVGYLVTLDISE